jgi:oligopeptide transport system substrate-binding protein
VNLDVASHYGYLQEGGKFNVARAGWVADYADAENFLALSISSNKTFNYSKFNNAEYDALMTMSYEEKDPAARSKLLHEAETILMKEQPVAPLLTQADLWLVSNRVKGWVDNAANEHLSRFLSVSE